MWQGERAEAETKGGKGAELSGGFCRGATGDLGVRKEGVEGELWEVVRTVEEGWWEVEVGVC